MENEQDIDKMTDKELDKAIGKEMDKEFALAQNETKEFREKF